MKVACIYLLCLFICNAFAALHPYWRLAWSDEFNNSAIGVDTNKWNVRNKIGNWGNSELQWYHPDQVSVSGGNLVIKAIKQSFGGQTYMSGSIDSQDKGMFTYGRYEFNVKMSPGKGMWPAIWLLSQTKCWALGAEMDIAEFRGSYPTTIGGFYHYASKCCTQFSGCISSKGSGIDVKKDLTKNFYVFALEWFPTNITWYFDGKVLQSFQTSTLTVSQDLSPHYWIINSAVGGSYPGNPDATTVFPNYLYVDYVRVYVWRASCSGTNVCSKHGVCCAASNYLCKCNSGWEGASCEFWVGSASFNFDAITSLDTIPNGWGNDYTLYVTANAAVVSGDLRLTLTSTGCPTNCGNKPYATGGWSSLSYYNYGSFSFVAKTSKVPGTGISLVAAGQSQKLEQISFGILGSNTTQLEIRTWTLDWMYHHANISLGFDASLAFHNYTVTYLPGSMTFYVDGVWKFTTTEVIPKGKLGLGVYYTAQPDWYGPFTYTAPSYAYLRNATWEVAQTTIATC